MGADVWVARTPLALAMAGGPGQRSDTMSESELFSVATRLYVRMRRNHGPAVDVSRLKANRDYAREVLKIAASLSDPEVHKLAQRFEELMFPEAQGGRAASVSGVRMSAPPPAPAADAAGDAETEVKNASRYVGHLR
jgi:hypothetical protein